VPFSLDEAAHVTVLVTLTDHRHVHTVRGPVDLGRVAAGRHSWSWDGRGDDRRHLIDGWYEIVLRATIPGAVSEASVDAYVDTRPDEGRFLTTRSTVYPAASIVSDRMILTYLRQGWHANESLYPGQGWWDYRPSLRVQLTIRDADGRLVWREARTSNLLTFNFWWYARGPGGEPLPEGSYDARVEVTDAIGNRSSFSRALAVSHEQLRPEVWTSPAIPAGDATTYYPEYSPLCNGCTDMCEVLPSDRFPHGLSFRPCTGSPYTFRDFVASPPVKAAPVDSFRITATGGPTTPGSDDVGASRASRSVRATPRRPRRGGGCTSASRRTCPANTARCGSSSSP
jgi:hypothetical protein